MGKCSKNTRSPWDELKSKNGRIHGPCVFECAQVQLFSAFFSKQQASMCCHYWNCKDVGTYILSYYNMLIPTYYV